MNREGHDNNSFFVGEEVEHTPAHKRMTLFVIGIQSHEDIHKWIDNNPWGISISILVQTKASLS
jgi:hypothetical protein